MNDGSGHFVGKYKKAWLIVITREVLVHGNSIFFKGESFIAILNVFLNLTRFHVVSGKRVGLSGATSLDLHNWCRFLVLFLSFDLGGNNFNSLI